MSGAQLDEHRLIHALGTADAWSRHAEELGYEAERRAEIDVDSHGLALDLACSGVGVAFTSEWLALPLLRVGALVRAHPASIEGSDGYRVSLRSDSRVAAAERFVRWLLEELDCAGLSAPVSRSGRGAAQQRRSLESG